MSIVLAAGLTNFRNYSTVTLTDLPSGLLAFHGRNGAGKTNILEAVSLLSPGRGLRGAGIADIQKIDSDRQTSPWTVGADIEGMFGPARFGTGADPATERRIIRINGENTKGQATLAEHIAVLWLTPQMDRLFIEGAGSRRRFFDRLVYSFDAGHAARVSRYEQAMAQRSRLLKESRAADPAWLAVLETAMAENGVAIAAARRDFIRRLQAAEDSGIESDFPRAALQIKGILEERLGIISAVDLEAEFSETLRRDRAIDGVRGGAGSGPHRSDFSAVYLAKSRPAGECSTGEQKALLIGIVLAQARLVAAAQGAPPILLLDEIVAHLDDGRRRALFDILKALGGQVWMTGTDAALFSGAAPVFFAVEGGTIRRAA